MKKRITLILLTLVATLILSACNMISGPEGIQGEKQVTVHVINENEDLDEKFTYNTEHEFLLELLEEKQEELGVQF